MSSSAAFEAYLGRRRRSADPGCEVGGSEADAIPAAVLRRRQLPPTATQPRRQESCPGQVMTAKLAGIAEENGNIYDDRYCCDGRGESLGLRRYSYDYFAHPTEQSTRSIPYKELDKIAAAAAKKKNDRNENFPKGSEIGEDGGRGRSLEEEAAAAAASDGEEGPEWRKYDNKSGGERGGMMGRAAKVAQFWRSFLVAAVPLAALPLLFVHSEGKEFKCAYVMVIMAVFWVTEALPLAITSLIPVALLPILGVMTTDAVGREYMKETTMMFVSGIIVAIAVEHCNLHKRIALNAMFCIGTSARRLMLGLMLPTMFLSMWISNTATTAMMVPIVDAVLIELETDLRSKGRDDDTANDAANDEDEDAMVAGEDGGVVEMRTTRRRESNSGNSSSSKMDQEKVNMRHMMFLSVAYAANTGGTGTLTGTGSNLVLKGVVAEMSRSSPINFANWMLYACPMVILNLLICWLWLQIWFLDWGKSPARAAREFYLSFSRENDQVRKAIRQRIAELGRMAFHEAAVLFLFVSLVALWFFRDPKFVEGWGNFVHVKTTSYEPLRANCTAADEAGADCAYRRVSGEKEAIDDATAGMLIVILLFVIPARPNFWPITKLRASAPSPGLLRWQVIHDRMPWSLVLLLGGGFALAKATQVSGLSAWLGSQLAVLDFLDSRVLVLIVIIGTSFATEVTSNVATCSILLPVLRDLARSLNMNPLYLMIPATLSCSYAFMLPVATPPNAIVYTASGMDTSVMIKCGFFVNVFCVATNFLCLSTYGTLIYGLDDNAPGWLT